MWVVWTKLYGALSLPACTSISTFLSAPNGTTFDSLGFYPPIGPLTLASAISSTIVTAVLLLLAGPKVRNEGLFSFVNRVSTQDNRL